MPQSFTHVLVHVIWSTRHRHPWLEAMIRARLFGYMSGICRNVGAPLVVAGGVDDHVHLLIELHATVALASTVRDIKANSSRFVHETWPELGEFEWQRGYSGFSVSRSGRDDVYRYIENQAEHHKTRSFVDELRTLFERHGMEWNPEAALD